jgi:hypothetical protein
MYAFPQTRHLQDISTCLSRSTHDHASWTQGAIIQQVTTTCLLYDFSLLAWRGHGSYRLMIEGIKGLAHYFVHGMDTLS